MTGDASPLPHVGLGSRWHLSLLGGVRLHDATTVHTRFATRAITALLARLVLWPQRDHPREELIELLWPAVDVATGRRRLRQTLSLLRAVLEPPQGNPVPVLQADRLSLRLVAGSVSCDVHVFEAHCRAGQRDAALTCYRGELMPGFYDDWIQGERTRLNNLQERLAAAQAPGPVSRLQSLASTPLAVPERPGQPPAGPALRTGLPGYLTRYFPQQQQLERLQGQVRAHRLVTLLGPGGSGKTRLAVALAEQLGSPTPLLPAEAGVLPFETVRFVPLAAVHSVEQLLGALQAALHIGNPVAAVDTLVDCLQGVRALLVLDNAEQLAGIANGVIDQLAVALPQLHLLVTSRCRLGLDGEREFPIETLPVPPEGAALPVVAASPAVALFVDRACAVRVDFHLSERNHVAVAELVRALQGMPLAIELAACRIRAFSPAQMLGMLRQPVVLPGATPVLDLLQRPGSLAALQSRHASMQRTIEWSWQQLSRDHQLLASAMAVFAGGCDAPMLAAVHSGGDVQLGLEQLQAHSLVHRHGSDAQAPDGACAGEQPRLRLYEPIREYAAAQFDAVHTARWRSRQRAWAVNWLQSLPATPPLARVHAELVNLSAAFASAAADAAGEDAVLLLLALYPLHEGVTLPAETLLHARVAVQSCADPAWRARGCSALAPLLLTAGDTQWARQLAESAVQATVLAADEAGADVATDIATGAAAWAPTSAATDHPTEHANKAAVQPAAPPGLAAAWALLAQATVHWRGALSPAPQVLPWVQHAQRAAQQHGDANLLASALNLMSLVQYGHDRDAEAARSLAASAQAVWEGLGNRHGANHARHNVAIFDFRAGRREQALAAWDAIAEEAAVLQDTRRLAIANSARCTALSDMRRWPQARQAMRESLRQSWRAMRLYEVSYDLWNLPRILAHMRQPEEAQCLMAFVAQFWESRIGGLTEADRRHVQLVGRLVARQLDTRVASAAAARGRQLPLADAVALALAS